MKRAILLDLDGTLVDSRPGIVASQLAALQELGHDPSLAGDLTWAVGPPLVEVFTRLLGQYGDTRVNAGIDVYRAHYGSSGIYQSPLYPGISAMIESLYLAGHELIVATAKRRDFALRIIERHELRQRFLGVYGSEAGGALDDKADLIAHILVRENLLATGCVMVGDRSHDIVAGHTNRMPAIGVGWGYGGAAELTAAGADVIIDHPADLLSSVVALD